MADYTKPTGDGGQLLIRVTDTEIQFFIKAGYSTTFGTVNWSGRVNGSDVSGSAQYPQGGNFLQLGSWPKGGSEVIFRIAATGTSGLGGPTELAVSLASAPNAPGNFRVEVRTPTRLGVRYDRGASNGADIIADEVIWYEIQKDGTSPVVIWTDNGANGYTDTNNGNPGPVLKPGYEYHIYVRSRNSAGWGPQAPALLGLTYGTVQIKVGNSYRRAIRWVKVGGVYRRCIPHVKVNGIYRYPN